MKRIVGGLLGAFFDIRVIIGVCGIALSILMHELFHLIMHWSEITSVHLLPNSHAIIEILFVPAHSYDLILEELFAYGITALTITLTATLIHDVNDQRDTRSVEQIIIPQHHQNATAHMSRQLHIALGLDTQK